MRRISGRDFPAILSLFTHNPASGRGERYLFIERPASRALSLSTSSNWRHPLPKQPASALRGAFGSSSPDFATSTGRRFFCCSASALARIDWRNCPALSAWCKSKRERTVLRVMVLRYPDRQILERLWGDPSGYRVRAVCTYDS